MAKIRLAIAEDETVVRMALAQLLAAESDIDVVGQAADGEAVVDLARRLKPEVVLTDLSMPKMDGIAAIRQIKKEASACAVVVLTIHHDDDHLFAAIKAGASGYVLKDAPAEQMVEAIRASARGEGYIGPSLVGKVLEEFARVARLRAAAKEIFQELTRREMEVLELVGKGLRNKDIAARLFLSEKTVKNHVSSIFMKLQVNDRTEAALLAERHGLTDPD
jgi:two-component system response regulator DegU